MKRQTLPLIILTVLCMLLVSLTSCDNGDDGIGTVGDNGVLTVVVSQTGSDTDGRGTEKAPFASLAAARDAVRSIDRTNLTGIDVLVKSGKYTISETFLLTAEDSGSETCPIRYIGEDGAYLYGGVSFTAADFSPLGDAEVVQYFPAEAKEHLVQIDLKQFGFKAEEARDMVRFNSGSVSFLYCDGERMDEARFPNAPSSTDMNSVSVEGWARVMAGSTLEPEWTGSDSSGDTIADYYVINFDEEYNERVHSWHDIGDGFVKGRLRFLWCSDDSSVAYLDPTEPVMKLYFKGGYMPREGMIFYWYHIPEELDVPGEYYIDDNCILYYYPTDTHNTATYTIPSLGDSIITLDGVDYITLDNLSVESSRESGIIGTGNHLTIKNCTVSGVLCDGMSIKGDNIAICDNRVVSTGKSGIKLSAGDIANLTYGENIVYNNYIADWSNVRGLMEMGLQLDGCGIVVSHNEICNSVDWGIGTLGATAYLTIEYNHAYNVGRFEGDNAAIHISQPYGCVIRYNYIHDVGFNDDLIDFVGVNGIGTDFTIGGCEVYGNIIANITGSGVALGGARNIDIHDNIFISCRRNGIHYTDMIYNAFIIGDISGTLTLPEYMSGETWLNAFPHMADVKYSGTMDDIDDPDFFICAAGSHLWRNFIYFDRSNCADPGKGNVPYKYYSGCRFSNIEEVTDDYIVTYTSKRNGQPDIKDVLETTSGKIDITYEQFLQMGRVSED